MSNKLADLPNIALLHEVVNRHNQKISSRSEREAEIAARKKQKRAMTRSEQIDKDMLAKYKEFEKLKPAALIANIAFTFLANYVKSGPMPAHSALVGPEDLSKFSYSNMSAHAMDKLASPTDFVRVIKPRVDPKTKKVVEPGSVLVRMNTPEIEVKFRLMSSVPYRQNADDQAVSIAESVERFEKEAPELEAHFAKAFPGFKIPRQYMVKTAASYGRREVVPIIQYVNSPLMDIQRLDKQVKELAKVMDIPEEDEIDFRDPNLGKLKNKIEVQFRMVPDSARILPFDSQNIDRLERDEGAGEQARPVTKLINYVARNNPVLMSVKFAADVYVRYPLDYALWSTCSKNVEDFDPTLFIGLHNRRVAKSVLNRRGVTPPPFKVASMDKVSESIRQHEIHYERKSPARTNKENFCTTKSGLVLWAPKVDITKEHTDLMKSLYNAETGKVLPPNVLPALRNRIIFTDWLMNKLSYTTTSGELDYFDLSGAGALSDGSIYNYLQRIPISLNQPMMEFLSTRWSSIVPYADFTEITNRIMTEFEQKYGSSFYRPPATSSPYSFISHIISIYREVTIAELANLELLGVKESENPRLHAEAKSVIEFFSTAWRNMSSQPSGDTSFTNSLTMYDRIQFGMFWIALFGHYAKDFERIREVYTDAVERNRSLDMDFDEYTPEVANLPGLTHVLPHQHKWLAQMEKAEPEAALEQVGVGGGKTPTNLFEVVRFLEKKKVNRALIIMPENLLPQYSSEIEFFSKGRLNTVVINTVTVDSMMKNLEDFDDKKLVNIIKKAPRNTIFLTSYDFLKKSDASNPEKRLLRRPDDPNSNVLFRHLEMVYGTFSFGGKTGGLRLFPMVELFSRCGFEMICLDESHRAKETATSDIAVAAANLMATAKYKRFLSGTVVTDKATDVIGPMSMIAPEVLGSKKSFANRFMKQGQLLPGKSQEIEELIRGHIKSLIFTQKDWAFIMPNIIQTKVEAPMTKAQQVFYDRLMQQAIQKFEKEVELLTGKKPGQKEMDTFYQQLEGDEDDGDENVSGSEEDTSLQERIEEMAKRALARVEVFISAPDEDKEKSNLEDEGDLEIKAFKNADLTDAQGNKIKLQPEDLISPKAKATYAILAAHFFGTPYLNIEKDTSQYNKVVVFSYNKPISRHVMRHMPPELKKMAVRYVASKSAEDKDEQLLPGKQALQKFMNDDKVKIIVADETSIAEGFNLQMASRLIRIQTVWSPGRQEQVNGRVLRPDPKDKYKRENIYVNLISAAHRDPNKVTVDDVKIARMLSKIISKARMDFRNTPSWIKEMENHPDLEDLPLVTMNLSDIDEMTKDDLNRYNAAARVYYDWLGKQFLKEREKLLEKLRKKFGPDVQMEDVRRLALVPVTHNGDMEGSAPYFKTILYGQKIHDEYGLDLIPVADADLLEDEDGGVEVTDGQAVWTLYGPGYVKTQFSKSDGSFGTTMRVDVPGFGIVSVPRGSVQVPSTEEGQRRLENLLLVAGPQGMPTIGKDGQPIKIRSFKKVDLDKKIPKTIKKPVSTRPVVDDEEDEDTKPVKRTKFTPKGIEDESDDQPDSLLAIVPASISGFPALVLMNNDPKLKRRFIQENPNWIVARRFYAAQLKTYSGFANAIKSLEENFNVSPKRIKYLRETLENMKITSKGAGVKGVFFDSQAMSESEVKNFYTYNHKPIKQPTSGKMFVEPWLMMWDGRVFLCFDSMAHGVKALSKIRVKLSRVTPKLGPLIEYPQEENDERVFYFFRSRTEAIKVLRNINEEFGIDEYEDILEEVRAIKAVRQKTERPTKSRRDEKPAPKGLRTKKAATKKSATKPKGLKTRPKARRA